MFNLFLSDDLFFLVMQSDHVFDVLIVYADRLAISATDEMETGQLPFSFESGRDNYNTAYAYFLETCQNFGLRAAFSTSSDIIAAGTCKSYWLYEYQEWKKVQNKCYSRQIFDKFSPKNKKTKLGRELLFSSDLIQPFNNPKLVALFFDKYETYKKLSRWAIPTVALADRSREGIELSLKKLYQLLTKQKKQNDFGTELVVKDRYGSGGNKVFKVTKNFAEEIYRLLRTNRKTAFIVQPLMQFENGFTFKNQPVAADIRLIYQNGKIIQTYIRVAKSNDFRCNEHQGGRLIYVDLADIPEKIIKFSTRIAKKIKQDNSLFALDYLMTNEGNVYLLEGNTGPGLDWNLGLKENETMSKKLIENIVTELARRANKLGN